MQLQQMRRPRRRCRRCRQKRHRAIEAARTRTRSIQSCRNSQHTVIIGKSRTLTFLENRRSKRRRRVVKMGECPCLAAAIRGVRDPCASSRLGFVETSSDVSLSSSWRTWVMFLASIAFRSLLDSWVCISLTVLPSLEQACLFISPIAKNCFKRGIVIIIEAQEDEDATRPDVSFAAE